MSHNSVSGSVLSYPISCPILSYPVLSYLILPYPILSYQDQSIRQSSSAPSTLRKVRGTASDAANTKSSSGPDTGLARGTRLVRPGVWRRARKQRGAGGFSFEHLDLINRMFVLLINFFQHCLRFRSNSKIRVPGSRGM